MTYEDFDDFNTIWTWVENEDSYEFKKVKLEHAVAGDTDSVMLSLPDSLTKKRSIDEIVSLADCIGSAVNESFHDWGIQALNCPPERTKYLSSDREVVASSALFLAKKRYVMKVIDDEGTKVDKLKIMGIELKRSSASSFLKEVLLSIVNAILDGESEDHIKDIMKKYKNDLMNRDITEIAVPSSCKTLNKAYETYTKTNSFKGLHITAKSALLFNLKRTPDDPIIYTGDKVYTLYINTRDRSIAFPVDSPPPQWVRDLPIDYDKIWEKVEKAVHNYISSMGWDFKSKAANKRKELFGF